MTVNIHLPDLLFVRQIEEVFSINRGVYNTIDSWFYEHGQSKILERRKHIVHFLQFIQEKSIVDQSKKRLSFPDGLTNTLETYLTVQQTG